MAAKKTVIDMKLQVRVEDESSGTLKYKNVSFSKVNFAATDEQLLAAGNAIAELQTRNLSGVRTVVTGDLAEE